MGPDDVAVFKCGACGHLAELPPGALLRGLALKPTDKVLDLERRVVCRLCRARGQAVVSIRGRERAEPTQAANSAPSVNVHYYAAGVYTDLNSRKELGFRP